MILPRSIRRLVGSDCKYNSELQKLCRIDYSTRYLITQFRTRVFVFQFFSVQGGNSTDVKIHSSEVKMYSADVKIQVKIRNQKIAIRCDVAYKVAVIGG